MFSSYAYQQNSQEDIMRSKRKLIITKTRLQEN